MTTFPDHTYLVLVDFGKSGRSILETDLTDCGIESALTAISEHATMARDLSVVATVYMVEAGKVFDVSEQVAIEWLKRNADYHAAVGNWPEFITAHAAPEAYDAECAGLELSGNEFSAIRASLVASRAARQGAVS